MLTASTPEPASTVSEDGGARKVNVLPGIRLPPVPIALSRLTTEKSALAMVSRKAAASSGSSLSTCRAAPSKWTSPAKASVTGLRGRFGVGERDDGLVVELGEAPVLPLADADADVVGVVADWGPAAPAPPVPSVPPEHAGRASDNSITRDARRATLTMARVCHGHRLATSRRSVGSSRSGHRSP